MKQLNQTYIAMRAYRLLLVVSLYCLFITTELFSRSNNNVSYRRFYTESELNYKVLSKLHRGETTEQETKSLLGLPDIIDTDLHHTVWYYKGNKTGLRIKFDKNQRLDEYEYQSSIINDVSKIESQQVKALSIGTTDIDLLKIIGEPTYVTVKKSGKEIFYQNLATHSSLQLTVDEKIGLVKNYQFLEEGKKVSNFDVDKITNIKEGKTTRLEIVSMLGQPTRLLIDKDKESLYYSSENAQLLINVKKGDSNTVISYQYSHQ